MPQGSTPTPGETFTREQRRTLLAAAVASLALTAWMGVQGTGSALHVWVGLLAFLAGGAAVCIGVAASHAWTSVLAYAYALLCAGAVLSVPLGMRWDAWRSQPTLEWCERLVAEIRGFEAAHGRLPRQIEGLGETGRPWCAEEVRYDRRGHGFTLRFGDLPFLGVDERTTGYDSARDAWWFDASGPTDG